MMNVKDDFEDAAGPKFRSSDDDDEATELEDSDTCNSFELQQLFHLKYNIADEAAVTMKKEYVLSLCKDGAFTRIAAGLSDVSVQLFDIDAQSRTTHLKIGCELAPPSAGTKINICGVKFLDETPNLLLVGSTNGVVRLFDLRAQGENARFENTSEEMSPVKSISCFDSNSNGRILCTGTEQVQNTVYLFFYDIRERKLCGSYNESHQDDITSVNFHSENPDFLCSGATDGLINIFDIQESSEDDALLNTLNTESSVHKVCWHKDLYGKDVISCITHTNDFKAYLSEEGDVIAEIDRADITNALKRKNPANCNLISAHSDADGGLFLLAGTNTKKGEVLRSLRFQNKSLIPLANYEGNKQIVRESLFEARSNVLVTAGESGIVSLWVPQESTNRTDSRKLKSKTKLKSSKAIPY